MNCAFPSFFATCRTRPSPFDPRSQRCVRHWLDCSVFCLASGLPSTTSACGLPLVFGSFAGTTPLYDSPLPCMVDLSLIAFSTRFLCVHGVFDSAGHGTLALSRTALLPSGLADAVGSLDCRFRSSIPSPHMPLSNASSAASRLPSHGSGSGWSLLLSCVTLSFTTPRRFIPALSSHDWLLH